jgi:hypothetical protein
MVERTDPAAKGTDGLVQQKGYTGSKRTLCRYLSSVRAARRPATISNT